MIKGVIFDMDGLLIDSEPFWREAEIEAFGKIGITLTEEMCITTMGRKLDEVIDHWYTVFPNTVKDKKELENEILEGVEKLILEKGKPLPGVDYILQFFKERGYKIGLASSSFMRLIVVVLDKLQIRKYFEVVHSAEYEAFGKPHPAVYLTAAQKLGITPSACIVFEDSYNGVLAGNAAGMKTVAIPDKNAPDMAQYEIADLKLDSLERFTEATLLVLNK